MQPTSYTLAENWGFQINFMVPLDKSGYKQCKEMAKMKYNTMKLEYTRLHELLSVQICNVRVLYRPGTTDGKKFVRT